MKKKLNKNEIKKIFQIYKLSQIKHTIIKIRTKFKEKPSWRVWCENQRGEEKKQKKYVISDKSTAGCLHVPLRHGGDAKHFLMPPRNLVFDQWTMLYAPPKTRGDTHALTRAIYISIIF